MGIQSKTRLWAVIIIALIMLLVLSGCGGGGGSGSSAHPPVISNLVTTRQSAYLFDGDGEIQIGAQVDFTDSGGDVNGFELDIYDTNDNLLQSLVGSILGASGITSGSGGSSINIPTTDIGNFRFELTFTDAAGSRSNTLTGIFPITGPDRVISNMPDTGTNRCFNQSVMIDCPAAGEPFHGQDFMVSSNELSLTDNVDGTVTDDVTSLVWQQENLGSYNWYQASGTFDATYNDSAIDACSIALAGRTDWRLPTRRELMTIVDYHLTINAIAGNELILGSSAYWALEDEGDQARYVDFQDGSVTLDDKFQSKSIRCVSGQEWGTSDFQDNGDGTVSDLASGLMWQATSPGSGSDWQAMLASCENLNLAGYEDWRLADIKELETTIGADAHLAVNQGIYCSSTTVAAEPDSVWLIQFHPTSNYADVFRHGAGNSKLLCSGFYSRCVR